MVESTVEELKRLGIGRKIRTLLDEKQLPSKELAEQVKLQPALLSQNQNDIVPPTLATLFNIARELEVNVDHFFMQQKAFEKV